METMRFTTLLFGLLQLIPQCMAAPSRGKICKGDFYVNSGNIELFRNCTTIEGYLNIDYETFAGDETLSEMEPSQLEVFSTLRELTGVLYINDVSHPNFTDLHYFRNLETTGPSKDYYSLYILNTSLKSLGLHSLKTVASLYIRNNSNLCFTDGINWRKFVHDKSWIEVDDNRPEDACVADNMVCHKECSKEGCWGPGVDECLSCETFSLENTCWDSCSYVGIYQSSYRTCGKCHKQCVETCTGPDYWECVECIHDGPHCFASCPAMQYKMNHECVPCNEKCAHGCTGPGDFVGLGGCDTCHNAIVYGDNPNQVIRCLKSDEPCEEGYFSELVSERETAESLKSMAGKSICRRCHPNCKKCTGYGIHVSVCKECSFECKGCWEPESGQNLKVSLGDNITHEINCSSKCPMNKPQSEQYCLDFDLKQKKDYNVPAIVGGVLGCTFLIGVVVAVVVYQWRQSVKSRENTVMTMIINGLEDAQPMTPSDLKPNLAKLKIIKECELRKGGILGYGAFGTVYKAVWVPEGDNVKIPVAIKILRDGTENANKEILEEAYIMATMVHPHLLRLLAVCMTSPQMALVTQLMPLGCLLDYVRSNKDKIGSEALLNWCMQIAKGMAYLEEKRLVHRDLAARNVLVQTPGCVKITDFGLAKLLDVNEEAYKATGGRVAIKWLAPECIQYRRYTHKSDIWAFGVTVWELLTYGSRPYERIPTVEVPDLLEKGERLTQPDICTIEVYMIMVKCWMLDAESRPSFKELAEEFVKMTRDPGRYLVIQGDSLMRLPTYTPEEEKELIRILSVTIEGTEVIMDAEDYLRPKRPDGNEDQDKSNHSYLEVFSTIDMDKDRINVNIEEEPIDDKGYLTQPRPLYNYAYEYNDLIEVKCHQGTNPVFDCTT